MIDLCQKRCILESVEIKGFLIARLNCLLGSLVDARELLFVVVTSGKTIARLMTTIDNLQIWYLAESSPYCCSGQGQNPVLSDKF